MEIRTRLGVMSSAFLRSSGTDKWVIAAGALYALENNIERLAEDPTVLAEIEREVADANERFAHAEQVRAWKLLPDEWLPDSEELTPTMKLKRRGIAAKYARQIDGLYSSELGS